MKSKGKNQEVEREKEERRQRQLRDVRNLTQRNLAQNCK